MPQSKKSTSGMGSIRKITKSVKGKEYTYYEARYTVGFDPGTGKQIQRSITDKSKKVVAQKLKDVLYSLDKGDYVAPCKMTVGEWLEQWAQDYLGGVKPATVCAYKATIQTHLKPAFGAVKLNSLDTHTIQYFYNALISPQKDKQALSSKTVKNIHGVLHKALQQAVSNGYLRINPTNACVLPRVEKKQIKPLDEDQISAFLKAIRGHRYENLFIITLFTGMRKSEAMGLTWDCVNFAYGTITVDKQLQLVRGRKGEYRLAPTKNSRIRTITVAPFVVNTLRKVQYEQQANKARFGSMWKDSNFVFTNSVGEHLRVHTVYKDFKEIVKSLGYDSARFHDLRHSYAVASIKSGDDIKTVQENLGHATASFTLDVYGHVTDQMKRASAERMEKFILSVSQ